MTTDVRPKLISAHGGGQLVDRVVTGAAQEEALSKATQLQKIDIDEHNYADLIMLATGGYTPLDGFMGPDDYERCVHELRLASGVVWSIPVVLPVSEHVAADLHEGRELALHYAGRIVGTLELRHKFRYDRQAEANAVYKTDEDAHPGVARLYRQGEVLLGGPVRLLARVDDGFSRYWMDPRETRDAFAERGWQRVVAFQTRNPIHRAHEYLQKCALETVDGLLLHPLVGWTKADDVSAEVRMRSYEAILDAYYPRDRVVLGVYPAFMRYGGPREALLHGLTRRNYGCTHFIVGRDAAGVGNYYGTYDSQKIFDQFTDEELGIQPIRFDHVFFCKVCGNMASTKTCPHTQEDHVFLSGTKVRELLRKGELPPPEFSRPEVARILSEGMREQAAG